MKAINVQRRPPQTDLTGSVAGSKRQKLLKRVGWVLIALAIISGMVTRIFAVFQYVTFDIGPDPDQIRDAFVVMDIWQGELPAMGPKAYGFGLAGFHVPPLYYYLVFPFTLLGRAPVFHAFPNALFSFLAIPLFIYLTYRLLTGVHFSKRLFLSGLSGLWYSLLFADIFISNFQWNPSAMPFFLMLFTLIYTIQCQHLSAWKVQIPAWTASGVVLAILVSLHTSALFVMPVVYMITALAFMGKVFKMEGANLRLALPGLGLLAAAISLTPYWISELQSNFSNTRSIVRTILTVSGSDEDRSLVIALGEKGINFLLHYLNSVRQVYFWNASVAAAVILALVIAMISSVAFSKFRGDQDIWLVWLATWGLLLLAASNLDPGQTAAYYRSLILMTPIVITVIALAYADFQGSRAIAYHSAIAVFIALSCWQNLSHDAQFMAAKYGPNRLINTREVAQVMAQLPEGARLCSPRIARNRSEHNQYRYIDTYVTHKGISAVSNCQAGDYVIHPKRILHLAGNYLNYPDYQTADFADTGPKVQPELWPTFEIRENQPIARPATLFLELQTATVYVLS